MGWKDLVVTPTVEIFIVAFAVAVTQAIHRVLGLGLLERVLIFTVAQAIGAIGFLAFMRRAFPLRQGIHSAGTTQKYIYNLCGLIWLLNLRFWLESSIIPPLFKQYAYRALGAKIGGGIVCISGSLLDPAMTTIGDDAIIGEGAMILGHAIGILSPREDFVMLGRVEIGKGVVIGARSMVLPGVKIGDYATVQAMSYVPPNTRIPAYEVWGGHPAKKVGEVRRA